MTPDQYIQACARTNANDEHNLPTSYVAHDSAYPHGNYCTKQSNLPWNILHGGIGICTEAGELLDAMKKCLFYGKDLDLVNLKEELGDLLWYVAVIMRQVGFTFEEVFDVNIAKLRARYPEKFTEYDALNRDLEKEREVLENKNLD